MSHYKSHTCFMSERRRPYFSLSVFLSGLSVLWLFFFFFQAEDGIRDSSVTGVQTCALPICGRPRLQNRIELRQQLRAKLRLLRFRLCRGLPRLFRLGFRGSLLRHRCRPVPRRLLCRRLRHLLLLLSRRASLLRFLPLPNCVLRGLLRFLLHAYRFRLRRFRRRTRLVRFLPTLYFRVRVRASFGFAVRSGSPFRGDGGFTPFLGLLFHGHYAGCFRGFHDFLGGGFHGSFVAPGVVDVFGGLELLFGLGDDRRCVLLG